MEGTKRTDERDASSTAREARSAAEAFLDARDSAGPGAAARGSGAPFGRDPRAAAAVADAVMARVREIGAPEALPAAGLRAAGAAGAAGVSRARAFRVASLAAAAVLVAALSSVVTLSLIRSGGTVEVRFVLVTPEAHSVSLAADFNQWSTEGYPLRKADDGTWEITVPLRKGRAYAYNFIIDGERWISDPTSPSMLDDGFGGSSSSFSL